MELLFNGLKANQVTGEIKVAVEKDEDRYYLGVILPNGSPWVFTDKEAANMGEVMINVMAFFPKATVALISIDEHNKIKKEWEVNHYETKRSR
jgi:hypothetical protein